MKSKTKKRVFLWTSVISIIIVLSLLTITVIVFGKSEIVGINYVYSDNTGIIKVEVKEAGWFSKLFNQQTTFDPYDQVEINTPVQLRSWIAINTLNVNPAGALRVTLLKNNVFYKNIEVTLTPNIQPGESRQVDVEWTPTQPGTYTTQMYFKCTTLFCISENRTWTRNIDPLETTDEGSLVVVDSTPAGCNNTNYCSGWSLDTNTADNGKVEKQLCYKIGAAPGCKETVDRTEYKTTCNTGYFIVGTTSTTANEIKDCELPDVVALTCVDNASLCVSPQICDSVTATCVDPSCTADVYSNCTNGTRIKTHTCATNVSTPTGITCPSSNSSSTTNNTSTTATNSTKCWKDKTIKQQAAVGDSDLCDSIQVAGIVDCEDKEMFDTKDMCEEALAAEPNWMLWGIIGGSVLFVFVIGIVLVIKFGGRRR